MIKNVIIFVHKIREPLIYLFLIILLSSMVGSEVYDKKMSSGHEDGLLLLNNELTKVHTHLDLTSQTLREFLDGWVKYGITVRTAEIELEKQKEEGTLPKFSCEAVFIREHVVE